VSLLGGVEPLVYDIARLDKLAQPGRSSASLSEPSGAFLKEPRNVAGSFRNVAYFVTCPRTSPFGCAAVWMLK
jgi:hypothetical protein